MFRLLFFYLEGIGHPGARLSGHHMAAQSNGEIFEPLSRRTWTDTLSDATASESPKIHLSWSCVTERRTAFQSLTVFRFMLIHATWLSTPNYLRRYDHGIFPSKTPVQWGTSQDPRWRL